MSPKPYRERMAICMIFLLTGIAMASWAPMVPYVKARMNLDEGQLGLLLFTLGAGALSMMPLTTFFINRIGSRKTILFAVVVSSLVLPTLTFITHPYLMAAALFIFGGTIGMVDVSMNTQAVIVEKQWEGPIMSSFHGLYSVGCIVGAALVALLLKSGLDLTWCAVVISSLFLIIMIWQYRHLLPHTSDDRKNDSFFAIPRGVVIVIGMLCFIAYIAEGALLDWSAVYLKEFRNMDAKTAGIGFAVFSVTMSAGRLMGDFVATKTGLVRGVLYGSWIAAIGYFIAVGMSSAIGTILGFALIGVGLSNIVPLLFSAAGNIKDQPASISIPAITTIGYTGFLLGPAAIGFVAKKTSLSISFMCIALSLLLIAFCARYLKRD